MEAQKRALRDLDALFEASSAAQGSNKKQKLGPGLPGGSLGRRSSGRGAGSCGSESTSIVRKSSPGGRPSSSAPSSGAAAARWVQPPSEAHRLYRPLRRSLLHAATSGPAAALLGEGQDRAGAPGERLVTYLRGLLAGKTDRAAQTAIETRVQGRAIHLENAAAEARAKAAGVRAGRQIRREFAGWSLGRCRREGLVNWWSPPTPSNRAAEPKGKSRGPAPPPAPAGPAGPTAVPAARGPEDGAPTGEAKLDVHKGQQGARGGGGGRGRERAGAPQLRFRDFVVLHDLWKAYIGRLTGPCGGNAKALRQRLLGADLQGAYVRVLRASAASMVGAAGIAFRETSGTIQVVTTEDQVKTFPKRGCVFALAVGTVAATLHGAAIAGRRVQGPAGAMAAAGRPTATGLAGPASRPGVWAGPGAAGTGGPGGGGGSGGGRGGVTATASAVLPTTAL